VRMSGDARQNLGRLGEQLAAESLAGQGMVLLERRYRCRLGEIDLIARDGSIVVFVEVKARRGIGFGRPAESVSRLKRRRIARVALQFLQRRGWLERICRFDVVEVLIRSGEDPQILHIPDAFRC